MALAELLGGALSRLLRALLGAGRIVEEGTHQSQVAKDGLYTKLAHMQFETGAQALSGAQDAAAE